LPLAKTKEEKNSPSGTKKKTKDEKKSSFPLWGNRKEKNSKETEAFFSCLFFSFN
jgi:hypothetical protein